MSPELRAAKRRYVTAYDKAIAVALDIRATPEQKEAAGRALREAARAYDEAVWADLQATPSTGGPSATVTPLPR